jgi:hypothetical protein
MATSLAGNAVDVLTITAPEGCGKPLSQRQGVVLSGRDGFNCMLLLWWHVSAAIAAAACSLHGVGQLGALCQVAADTSHVVCGMALPQAPQVCMSLLVLLLLLLLQRECILGRQTPAG